jgi:hypothetical protein
VTADNWLRIRWYCGNHDIPAWQCGNWTGHHLQNINKQFQRQIPYQIRENLKIFVTFDDCGFHTATSRARTQKEMNIDGFSIFRARCLDLFSIVPFNESTTLSTFKRRSPLWKCRRSTSAIKLPLLSHQKSLVRYPILIRQTSQNVGRDRIETNWLKVLDGVDRLRASTRTVWLGGWTGHDDII